MSAGLLGINLADRIEEEVRPQRSTQQCGGWNPANFAREQIQGLVRQVFFSNPARPVRQVVFSAADPETDVRTICRRVGEALALETPGSVAVVGGYPQLLQDVELQRAPIVEQETRNGDGALRRIATRVRGNLWLVPAQWRDEDPVTANSLHFHLSEMRGEFEYSIVAAPSAGESNEAMAMAQVADGTILVLSADHTRRASARKVKEKLEGAQVRILGTVLCDRTFSIPEAIYRRL